MIPSVLCYAPPPVELLGPATPSGVDDPERRSGTCYLAGTCIPVLIDKSTRTLSTYRSSTYL